MGTIAEDLVKLAINTGAEMMKTEDGRKALASVIGPMAKICRPKPCRHNFDRLFWINPPRGRVFNMRY